MGLRPHCAKAQQPMTNQGVAMTAISFTPLPPSCDKD